jgi:[protein-PII] uridylyltransferase
MDGLIERIASEGQERLGGLHGRSPEELRPIFKKFVENQTRQIRREHESGAGGLAVCRARAAMLDVVVVKLLNALWPAAARPIPETPFALVATGGYGRAELNPASDIDLLFLEGGGVIKEDGSTPLSTLPPTFIQMLYDIGLEPGDRAVRTIEESIRLAAKDMETKTSLLEARLLAGDEKLFRALQTAVREKCLKGKESAYIQARLEDQEARRLKHGNSPCMQEPNIKNGVGGLRDYQNLLWMAQVKYGIHNLAELEEREMLDAGEREQLERAYDFLLRVRTELHLVAGRGSDTLTPNFQPAVAAGLCFSGDPRRRTERFMHE